MGPQSSNVGGDVDEARSGLFALTKQAVTVAARPATSACASPRRTSAFSRFASAAGAQEQLDLMRDDGRAIPARWLRLHP